MTTVPWVCGACRSINQPRESRCYRCRTPRDLGEVDPEQLITAGAGSTPEPIVRPMGAYRSSASRAMLTQVLVGAALAVTVVSSFLGADLVGRVLDEGLYDRSLAASAAMVGVAGLGLAAAALVAWAAWLSRVVDNVPKLGLGWPNVTPTAAVYESIFPGVNLYRVPAILRDVVGRLEPNGRGEALIAATWLALVGGAIAPRVLRLATAFAVGDVADLARAFVVVGQLGLGLTVAGGGLLIVLIQWIERRMAARARLVPAVGPEVVVREPTEPTRAQTIGEAAGVSAASTRTEPPAAKGQPDDDEERLAPARPRWGGAVATPGQPSASPASRPAEQASPTASYTDPDDMPLGEDHSLD